MAQRAIYSEDVLERGEEREVSDCRTEFLIDFAGDRIPMGFADFDTAADQAVVSVGVRQWAG